MRDPERVKRANRILIVIVILFLLYGIIYRIQTGDNGLYVFGHRIDLPFGTQQETTSETGSGTEDGEEAAEEQTDEDSKGN